MSFLYPSFLWALGVLSIPLIIHLFNFRRTTRVYFSNTRFLKQVKEATTARRKLKHYLILASRLLFLFFLVMVFCQPIIPARNQFTASHSVVLYVDNSQSMSAQMDDKTRGLDAAIAFMQSIVSTFPPDTRYRLITNDFAPFSNSFKTRVEVQDLLTQVRLSPVSRSLQEVHDRILQDGTTQRREVFWVSDFQKSTLGVLPASLDSAAHWHLVPIRYTALSNVFVDTAYLENPFAAGGERNVLHVTVHNDGTRDADQLSLKLSINDIQSGASAVTIPTGGKAETTFDLATGLSGLNRAHISFHDFPVSFDNDFYLALNFTSKIKVVEIKGVQASTSVEKVYGNTQVFSYHGFSVTNFNYHELSNADLVVVNGLNTVDVPLINALRAYVSGGGTLAVVPGTNPDAESYKNLLQVPSLQVVAPEPATALDKPDFANPFFENVFEEKSIALAMPKAARVLSWTADRSALLRFKNDAPFLSVFNQTGKVYLMASALANESTDFHQHGIFVPVMYRIAASGKKSMDRLYYTLRDNFITVRADSLPADVPLKLVGREEIIPGQHKSGTQVMLDIPKFSVEQGFYRIVSQRDTIGLVAFNVDKAESRMDQYTGQEVLQQLSAGNNVSVFEAASAATFASEIKERYLGTPLWKYALMLALLFLVAEVLLIRFMK